MIISYNIDSLCKKLYRIENTLGFIRALSTPHSIISVVVFKKND